MATTERQQSRAGRARTRLTPRGAAMLVASVLAFVAAYSIGSHALLVVGSLLAALPLLALLMLWVRRLRVEVTRSYVPGLVAAGKPTRVELEVRNLAAAPTVEALWTDTLPWHLGTTDPEELVPLSSNAPRFARKGNQRTLAYTLVPPRRGVVEVGPVRFDYSDPFGLASGSVSVREPEPLVVTPAIDELPQRGLALPAGDGSATLIQRRAAGNDDDIMTREYRSGDALRRVHWRASARQGELMVRQEEQRSHPDVRLLLDTLRPGYPDARDRVRPGEEESASFEWAVSMFASLGVYLHHSGFSVHVRETGDPQAAPLGDGSLWMGHDENFLRSLADIRLLASGSARRAESEGERVSGSLYAVLSHPDPETLEWIASRRRSSERAVAFIIGARSESGIEFLEQAFDIASPGSDVVRYLEGAGWLCIPVRVSETPLEAWSAVVAATGQVHDEA